jgi:hypothetical protein
MKFTEVDLFGVYITLMSVMMIVAWLVVVVLRHVWHPALFVGSRYVIVLSSPVLIAAR